MYVHSTSSVAGWATLSYTAKVATVLKTEYIGIELAVKAFIIPRSRNLVWTEPSALMGCGHSLAQRKIRDNKDYIRVSSIPIAYYTTLTRWGVLLNHVGEARFCGKRSNGFGS